MGKKEVKDLLVKSNAERKSQKKLLATEVWEGYTIQQLMDDEGISLEEALDAHEQLKKDDLSTKLATLESPSRVDAALAERPRPKAKRSRPSVDETDAAPSGSGTAADASGPTAATAKPEAKAPPKASKKAKQAKPPPPTQDPANPDAAPEQPEQPTAALPSPATPALKPAKSVVFSKEGQEVSEAQREANKSWWSKYKVPTPANAGMLKRSGASEALEGPVKRRCSSKKSAPAHSEERETAEAVPATKGPLPDATPTTRALALRDAGSAKANDKSKSSADVDCLDSQWLFGLVWEAVS